MTSLHRLLAIVTIWICAVPFAWILSTVALLGDLPWLAEAALFAMLLLSAAAGTWAVAASERHRA